MHKLGKSCRVPVRSLLGNVRPGIVWCMLWIQVRRDVGLDLWGRWWKSISTLLPRVSAQWFWHLRPASIFVVQMIYKYFPLVSPRAREERSHQTLWSENMKVRTLLCACAPKFPSQLHTYTPYSQYPQTYTIPSISKHTHTLDSQYPHTHSLMYTHI